MGRDRIVCLTGIKGAASLIVMTNHFAAMFLVDWASIYKRFPFSALFNGTCMLYLFYFLSAFFVAQSYFRHHDRGKLQKQILLRAPRLILPVFFVCCFVFLLGRVLSRCGMVLPVGMPPVMQPGGEAYAAAYSLRSVFTRPITCIIEYTTDFTFVLWMMPRMYFGFFIACIWMLSIDELPLWCAGCLTLAACAVVFCRIEDETFAAFLLGVFLAKVYVEQPGFFRAHTRWKTALAALAGCLALYLLCYLPYQPAVGMFLPIAPIIDHARFGFFLCYTVFAGCAVFAVLYFSAVQRIFSTRPMLFFGKLCMTIYLFHDPIQQTLGRYAMLLLYRYTGRELLSAVITYFVCAAAVVAIAYPVNRFLEEPSLRLVSRCYDALIGSKPAAGTMAE